MGWELDFSPATKSIPKEMIPIVDTPMIQYIVEEAVKSGIEEIILVTARHKETIENHFDLNPELEDHLEKQEKREIADLSRSLGKLCQFVSVRQKQPLGLGHAILCAEPWVRAEPFAVLLPDDIIDSEVPCIGQLKDVYLREMASVVGVIEVLASEVSKYGIIGGIPLDAKLLQVESIIEKPSLAHAPSRWAIPGRYVLSPSIFNYLRNLAPSRNGEIQLTDGLQALAQSEKLFAFAIEGKRYDTGDQLGYLDATLAYALKRPELAPKVRDLMKKHLEISS